LDGERHFVLCTARKLYCKEIKMNGGKRRDPEKHAVTLYQQAFIVLNASFEKKKETLGVRITLT
jgi:hypothetical protein